MEFKKWNSLNQFHEVMKNIQRNKQMQEFLREQNHKITFKSKVKLHGTNAGICIDFRNKEVKAMKRSSFIDSTSDNLGFAKWVEDTFTFEDFEPLQICTGYIDVIRIYGEWCGPGVQSDVACSHTNTKNFYIFCMDIETEKFGTFRHVNPRTITDILVFCQFLDRSNVFIIPWHDYTLELDFSDANSMSEQLKKLNEVVEGIGQEDPYIKEKFDISGKGEGLVLYPHVTETNYPYIDPVSGGIFSWFNFKAKCEKHRVNKTKTAVAIDPEVLKTNNAFLDKFCTEQRFEQGWQEALDRDLDIKRISDLIKWVVTDIQKESKEEIEASNLDWKKVSGGIGGRVANWYKAKLKEEILETCET